jgi:hypothetical protein
MGILLAFRTFSETPGDCREAAVPEKEMEPMVTNSLVRNHFSSSHEWTQSEDERVAVLSGIEGESTKGTFSAGGRRYILGGKYKFLSCIFKHVQILCNPASSKSR